MSRQSLLCQLQAHCEGQVKTFNAPFSCFLFLYLLQLLLLYQCIDNFPVIVVILIAV